MFFPPYAFWRGLGVGGRNKKGSSSYSSICFFQQLSDTASPDKEQYVIPVLHQCYSQYEVYFTCALYGFKGIILVFGIFLAWETRTVKVRGLNDSKWQQYVISIIHILNMTLKRKIALLVDQFPSSSFVLECTGLQLANFHRIWRSNLF